MKIILFFLIFIVSEIHTQENFALNFNVGSLGGGWNIPTNDTYSLEGRISLFNIGLEHRKTGIGIEFSPYNSFNWARGSEVHMDNSYFSLINFKLYWNIFNHNFSARHILLAPFVSINYMFFGNEVYFNRHIFTGGIHIGYRITMGDANYNVFSVNTGFRNINGRNKYFIGFNIDIIAFFIFAILGAAQNDEF